MSQTEPSRKNSSPIKFLREHFVWVLSVVALMVGVIIVFVSLQMSGPIFQGTANAPIPDGGIIVGGINAHPVHDHSIWREIFRDIGIACMVAAVVTAIFELHVRSRSDLETIAGVLNMTMGDVVRPDIWREVKAQVIQRTMVRERMEVRITGVEPVGGAFGPAILTMHSEYDLHGLHYKKEASVEVAHDLDEHVPGNDMPGFPQLAGLPKFDYIKVGDKVIVPELPPGSPAPASEYVKGGKLKYQVELPPRDQGSVHVAVRRKEVFYIPGSYNLALAEITNGVVLQLESLPDDIEVSINLRPHDEGVPLPKGWPPLKRFERSILLPGQVIEFRFKRIPRPADPVTSDDGEAGAR